jgi:hypothetical protein
MSEALRGWLYRLATTVLALAAIYGWVSDEQLAAWSAVVGALSGLLASFNTTVIDRP